MQLKKSFQNLSKSNSSCANRKSFQNLSKSSNSSANRKSFKISQSLAIEVQSLKSRFEICESQELVMQIESRFKTVKV